MNEEYYLRVDCSDKEQTVSINGNKKGLEYLKDCIEDLLENRGNPLPKDISLMIPNWGGEGLTEDKPFKNRTMVAHLRLYRWE